jgi:hypothetical protein
MKTDFTNEEMEKLLMLVSLGDWIVNANNVKPAEEFEAVKQKYYRAALEQGLGSCLKKNELDNTVNPSKSFEETIMKYVGLYDEDTFWEELRYRLVERDMTEKYGSDNVEKMSDSERFKNEEEFHDIYGNEFEANGLENIEIVQKEE